MLPRLPTSQLTFLLGMALLIAGGLVIVFYALHKAFARARQPQVLKMKSPRPEDESAFAMATMQGVIANLKEQEKKLNELRRLAEQQADENARINEIIIREVPTAVMVFNREGFLTVANPTARTLLGIDPWARRRYPEILAQQSALVARIQEVFQAGKTIGWESVEVSVGRGAARRVQVFLSPFSGKNGEVAGVVCLASEARGNTQEPGQVRVPTV